MLNALPPLVRSPSLHGAMIFAMSGAAFALGNLLMASAMAKSHYAHFALVLAILAITSNIGPLGLDQILLRRDVRAGWRYLAPILASTTILAMLAAAIAYPLYGINPRAVTALAMATISFALLRTSACGLRRHGMALTATLCETSADWCILAIGMASWAGWIADEASASLALATAGSVMMAVAHIILLRQERDTPADTGPFRFIEAIPLLGIVAAGAALVQAERLLIPFVLSLEELATFAVLTSVAIAPFRVLSAGIVASLTQQLRGLHTLQERRELLAREIRIFAVLSGISALIVCTIAPPVANIFTGGRYGVGIGLCLAACVNGIVKILQAVPRAVATGIGTAADLHRVNVSMWLCVLGTILGALFCAPWGLSTFMLGAATGSGLGTLPALLMVRKKLSLPTSSSSAGAPADVPTIA